MSEQIIDYKRICARIRTARKEQNITQERLSSLTGLSVNHISYVETGQALSLPALLAICNALNCTADRLLYDNLAHLNPVYLSEDIRKCFHDTSKDESSIMLAVANTAKEAFRNTVK